MIRLRPYKHCDAEKIVSWFKDEKTFLFWGGDHFGDFPISADIMNHKYFNDNGDCIENDNFYPMTAFDDKGIVGHFIMRYLGGDNRIIRFGWVVVDDEKRGHKYGQQMLKLGLKYAFEIMKADKVTIGVFKDNISAYKCYRSIGFHESLDIENSVKTINGEEWKIIELEILKEEFIS